MKKTCKRLLGLTLALCLLISIVPAVAAEGNQIAATNIYTADFGTTSDGTLADGWNLYVNDRVWDEAHGDGTLSILPEYTEGLSDGDGLILTYSENGLDASFLKNSGIRPYCGLYYQLDNVYDAISINYTHTARGGSKLGKMLMPACLDENGNFVNFPLDASIYGDVLTVTWEGDKLLEETISWKDGKEVKIIGYASETDGGKAVGFALYIGGEFKCSGTTLIKNFAGFNAMRFGFNRSWNCAVAINDIVVDTMDVNSFGVYDIDNPVEKLGYQPDVMYADPLHTVVSNATSGYAFMTWKVDNNLLYAPNFYGAEDGALADGWELFYGTSTWNYDDTTVTLPLHATLDEYSAAGRGLLLDYEENSLFVAYAKNTVPKKYRPGLYYQLGNTYSAMSVSYDHQISAGGSKMGDLMMPVYYDAETGKLTSLPLSIIVYGDELQVTWCGDIIADLVPFMTSKNYVPNVKVVAYSSTSEIGFAMYVDGEYWYGGTTTNDIGIPGFNAVSTSFLSDNNCALTMKNIVVRSMDMDSIGVYNLDNPMVMDGYILDKQYADPLHTVVSTATTGYVFATWKEDSSFLKRFDFSNDMDGTLPSGWELSMADMAWDYGTYEMPLHATVEEYSAAGKGLLLDYESDSMMLAYAKNSLTRYATGVYYQFGDTYESMTVSYDHIAPGGSKIGNFLMPTYYDENAKLFTSIPLEISMANTTTVTWNGEKLVDAEDIAFKNGKNVKIFAYSADAEGGKKEVGFELYLDGTLKCSGSTIMDSFPGFNAIRVQAEIAANCSLTMKDIAVNTDLARIGTDFYRRVEDAAKGVQAGDTLVLLGNYNDTINVGANITIDLNGHKLGSVVIADGATLSGVDSANNDYSTCGTIASVSGNVASTATVDGRSYIAIADGNGYGFHRYYLKTVATVLHVDNAAPSLYYKYALAGDEAVLSAIDSCGVAYWVGESEETVMAQTVLPEGQYSAGTAAEAAAGELYTGEGDLVSFTSDDVESVISGRAYIQVGDTVIYSDNCLADTAGGSIETADSLWDTLLVEQKNALKKLYEAFADVIGLLDVKNYNADTEAVLASFQEDLAQEEGYAATYLAGWENTENTAKNGDFSNGITDWTVYSTSAAEAVVEDGNTVLSLSRVTYEDATTSQNNPFVSQSAANLVPGSRCEISFRYKVVSVAEGGSVSPCVYVCWEVDGTEHVEGVWPYTKAENGEWGTASGYVYLPENATDIYIRVRARTTVDAQVYFDDVIVRSEHIALNTQDVFFYTDSRNEAATLTASIYGGDCSTVTFQVYRATEQVWASDAIAVADGKASVSFALSNLTQLGEPYAVVATAKNSDGNVTYVQTQNIYMYHRPTHFNENNEFVVDGEVVYPVFGYGVSNYDVQSEEIAMENAISVARIGTFTTADSAVAALDTLAAKGMMGMICMHPGMHASGSVYNMESTLAIMGDPRVHSHPALFGYCVQDEAFVNYTDGDPLFDLENTYRLIRKLDNKHIIMATENYWNHYADTSVYLDALIADVYCDAAEQAVYNRISLASQATEKPVYALTRSCILKDYPAWPTIDDMRSNNYQALLGGATGLGYYRLREAYGKADIWDAANEDGTGGNPELWAAMQQFYMNENELLMEHFYSVDYETIQQNLVKEESYWHYSFEADGSTYVILLGMMEDAASSVAATVSGGWTDCTVSVVAGTDSVPALTDGVLSVTVNGVEAILCQITPNA